MLTVRYKELYRYLPVTRQFWTTVSQGAEALRARASACLDTPNVQEMGGLPLNRVVVGLPLLLMVCGKRTVVQSMHAEFMGPDRLCAASIARCKVITTSILFDSLSQLTDSDCDLARLKAHDQSYIAIN